MVTPTLAEALNTNLSGPTQVGHSNTSCDLKNCVVSHIQKPLLFVCTTASKGDRQWPVCCWRIIPYGTLIICSWPVRKISVVI